MPLFVDDGWVLSSPLRGPSKWELSITTQEAPTTSAILVGHLNWELREGHQRLPLWLFFCPVTYNHVSVSSLSSWIGRLLCFDIVWSLPPVERDVWLQDMCLMSGDQLGLFGVPSGAFLFPDLGFHVWFLLLPVLYIDFVPFFIRTRIFFPIKWWLLLLLIPGCK